MTVQKFFTLANECFLIDGARRAAIYELNNGEIYSISDQSKTILHLCEQGVNINDIYHHVPDVATEEVIEYLSSLNAMKLGTFSDTKLVTHRVVEKPKVKLNFLWLELNRRCNQQCLHCYNSSSYAVKEKSRRILSLKEWQSTIQEGHKMGADRLQFTGGEPMLFGNNIFLLAQTARKANYNTIEIFTNATTLTDRDIDQLSELNIRVATNIYSKRAEIHDQITGLQGSFNQVVVNVKKMQNKGVRVFLATVLMKQNELLAKETIDFIKQLGEPMPLKHFDIVRPVGRGRGKDVISDSIKLQSRKRSPIFSRITRDKFITRVHGHSCWWGNAVVTSDGNVLPCIMTNARPSGNVRNKTLTEIISSSLLEQFWSLSKDKIPICQDCEYRYACMDCRPLAMGRSDDLYSKNTHCNYDPYTGVWLR